LVFLLYAEEREMLPEDDTFLRFYSLAGLHERLREDNAHHPDTMGQRYGAWAQLLVLFRMIHDGAQAGGVRVPKRHGVLFDPDRFPFLEGRREGATRQVGERIEPPLVPDATVYRALDKLLVLDGERLSYRALDVEQIGSVYETMMGFRLEVAGGRSVAIKAQGRHGAPTTVNLEALLDQESGKRAKWLQDRADRKLTPKVSAAVREAVSLEDLHAALAPVTDSAATPDLVPQGALILQPSEERRRSGSHYTPRALTEPIVRTTLEPILDRLRADDGQPPRPAQILDLKVCDPAMGSGAFLVEACRQLGDALVEAWGVHGERPQLPSDEDEVVLARRMVAQRCLYGVDRNPVAVDLAKMSLWLVTLAREHPLTFVDHALRHGDSLVGLSRRQIESFHWDSSAPGFEAIRIRDRLTTVAELRTQIREAGDDVSDFVLRDLWDEAQSELEQVRLLGDLVPAAFFTGTKPKEREAKRVELASAVAEGDTERHRDWIAEWRHAEQPLVPFHWEIEFPEVFDRRPAGFDVIVGNPPFMGGSKISSALGSPYLDWILGEHSGAHGNGDLVAHFFRRAFNLLRIGGGLGLIATNTIGQGDTRGTGLQWICTHGGEIYDARKRVKWPGLAAVIVSIVHVLKGTFRERKRLDGRDVDTITAFLFHRGGHDVPARLRANARLSFTGAKIYGQGFTFDDTAHEGVASG
ncbi:MAG: BREX-1 system adenine-specific DNA-methyltransferase PglX, partial [Actinomycetota bacterium]|nr:BREX-1 system adenine-specific DNA-methyltransferase PglX [Actinomycetota bacterium]